MYVSYIVSFVFGSDMDRCLGVPYHPSAVHRLEAQTKKRGAVLEALKTVGLLENLQATKLKTN